MTMPIDAQSLILKLRDDPTQLFLSSNSLPNKPLRIADQVTTLPSFPPWPVCADVLVSTESRGFVGITYPVDRENRDLVRRLCSSLPGDALRYNDLTVETRRKPYLNDDAEIHRLEILWSDIDADEVRSAQLDSGMWYYSNELDEDIRVMAFGLTDINIVLAEYDLVLPAIFRFPSFFPEFVG
jgi:hypothetical protein